MSAGDPGDRHARSLRHIEDRHGIGSDVPAALVISGCTAAAVAILGFLATRSLAVAGVCAVSAAVGVALAAVIISAR